MKRDIYAISQSISYITYSISFDIFSRSIVSIILFFNEHFIVLLENLYADYFIYI